MGTKKSEIFGRFTWIIAYYQQPEMLKLHMEYLADYPNDILPYMDIIYIDDCSGDDTAQEILSTQKNRVKDQITLLRVLDDIKWNQHGARNLGAKQAKRNWLLLTDMDRVLLAHDAEMIMNRKLSEKNTYKPVSTLVGAKRLKSVKKPFNQLLCTKKQYWDIGGYDEDYCGSYGGDGQFLGQLFRKYPCKMMFDVRLIRYNKHSNPDAETNTLDRVGYNQEYKRRLEKKLKAKDVIAKNPIRFRWEKVKI